MAKRKRKKLSSTLTWKTLRGLFGILFKGTVKSLPLVCLALAGFGVFWGIRAELYADPGFTVQQVEIVSPEHVLSPEKIRELERLYLGRNLFTVSLSEASRLMQENPHIHRVRVTRKFPKTLQIEILHREAFAQLQFIPRGINYIAGADGMILETALERRPGLLGVDVSELKNLRPEVGKKIYLPGFEKGVALASAFRRHPLGKTETIEKLRLDHLGGVTLVLRDGPELRFGSDPLKKLNLLPALASLLKGPERDRIVYIELQYQDLIVKKR